MSIKALARAVLQGNHQGNFKETESFHAGNFKETRPERPLQVNLNQLVTETLEAVDSKGRPWPVRFMTNLPAEDRNLLRAMEKEIDMAVLSGHKNTLTGLLEEWREFLLGCLH